MKLALGTVQFGLDYGINNRQGQVSIDQAKAILEYAAANGVNTLDTAIAYGDSEQRLGNIGVENWRVVSKLPPVPEGWHDMLQWVKDSVKESLHRLKIKNLYGLLLHRPQQLLERDGDRLYHALQQLKNDGLIHKIGISIYDPSELDALCPRYHLEIVQAPFNILDRRLIDTGWLSRLVEQDTEVHVRSVFLQGLLLMQPTECLKKFVRWEPLWNRWQEWLSDTGLTPVQACLRFVLAQPQIDRVIVGVDSLAQIKEIIRAANGDLQDVPSELQCDDIGLINPANWELV